MSWAVADAVDYKGFPADKSKTGGWIPAALILGTSLCLCLLPIYFSSTTFFLARSISMKIWHRGHMMLATLSRT